MFGGRSTLKFSDLPGEGKTHHNEHDSTFFLVSENLMNYVKDVNIYVGYCNDHSLIGLELEFKKETRQKKSGNLTPHY